MWCLNDIQLFTKGAIAMDMNYIKRRLVEAFIHVNEILMALSIFHILTSL